MIFIDICIRVSTSTGLRTRSTSLPCVILRILNILINNRLSISFPTGLPSISACRWSATPTFASVLAHGGFSLRHRVFTRARTFSRAIHTFPRSRKKGVFAFQFTFLLFPELLLSNNGSWREHTRVHKMQNLQNFEIYRWQYWFSLNDRFYMFNIASYIGP